MRFRKIKLERVFLVASLFFGCLFSIIFPIFYEGDAQFHFDYSTYQADVVVDRSKIGSSSSFGYNSELSSMQKGDYFEKYFKTKLEKVDRAQATDKRVTKPAKLFGKVSHVIPAIGVWLGYHIYPSVGVMVVVARLLATLFYSFSLFFIIKKVNYGKQLFFLTALTPVMAIQGFSLSYDSFSFVVCAALIASQINFFFEEKIRGKDFLKLGIMSLLVLLFTKENMKLLLIISFFALLSRLVDFEKIERGLYKYRKLLIPIGLVVIFGVYVMFATSHGGFKVFSLRMFNTFFTIESEQYTRGIFLGIFGNYTASYSLPWWCIYGYAIVTFLMIFSEKMPKISKSVALISFSVFFINVFGTTALYSMFNNSVHSASDVTQVIGGQLGRYYTPLLPCLLYIKQLCSFEIAMEENQRDLIVIGWSVFCLALLTVVTLYGFYYLKVPAFIQ